ncbi:MAG: ABC transporter ATP-binding protein [Burkholderiales bacterium]
MLEVLDLEKCYPGADARPVFRSVSFTLAAGESLAVMGASGAGKSTLLNLIAGLDTPDHGSVRLDGLDVCRLDDRARSLLRRRRIGFVFQAFHLLPHLSALDNVRLPLDLDGVPGNDSAPRAHAALAAVGLAERAGRRPRALSGGEQQRVAIARALVHRPRLILADEPTGNLDADSGRQALDVLRTAAREHAAALILVTHAPAAAAAMDRVCTLAADGLREGAR